MHQWTHREFRFQSTQITKELRIIIPSTTIALIILRVKTS